MNKAIFADQSRDDHSHAVSQLEPDIITMLGSLNRSAAYDPDYFSYQLEITMVNDFVRFNTRGACKIGWSDHLNQRFYLNPYQIGESFFGEGFSSFADLIRNIALVGTTVDVEAAKQAFDAVAEQIHVLSRDFGRPMAGLEWVITRYPNRGALNAVGERVGKISISPCLVTPFVMERAGVRTMYPLMRLDGGVMSEGNKTSNMTERAFGAHYTLWSAVNDLDVVYTNGPIPLRQWVKGLGVNVSPEDSDEAVKGKALEHALTILEWRKGERLDPSLIKPLLDISPDVADEISEAFTTGSAQFVPLFSALLKKIN